MNSKLYYDSLENSLNLEHLIMLKDKTVLITGATGLIGSYFVDSLMFASEKFELNIKVYILSRSKNKILDRFSRYINNENFEYIIQDVCEEIVIDDEIDYIFHAASNANPRAYSMEPINTLVSNFMGMKNILELARKYDSKVIYFSSSEAYGKGEALEVYFDEKSGGFIDTTSFRSAYPISKLVAENLAACYKKEHNIDFYVVRICHVYGPTMQLDDNRAVSSFLKNAINFENIILKSDGSSKRSYCYVGDLFEAIMVILNKGNSGEVYNFSSQENFISIRELANVIASYNNMELVFDIDNPQVAGNTNEFIYIKDEKLKKIGFKCKYDVKDGVKLTLDILMDNNY